MDIFVLGEELKRRNFIVTDQRNDNIRAELKYNNATIGIYYFVLRNDIFDNEFDLIQFQEELLAEDYYSNRGAIQWNYYLVFVTDDKKIDNLSDDEKAKKEEIENDVIFSRKYIVGFLEVEQIILRANFEMLSKLEKDNIDISTVWIEKLKEVQLDGVFLNDSYTSVVDQYIDGNPVIEDDEGTDNDGDIITDSISFIKDIHIKQYRRVFPNNKTISFKKVNLIKGPNGVGKTSLLEALELVICGRTFRSGNKAEPNANLEAKFCGIKDIDEYEPEDNKKYRDRDSRWYGNSGYKSGNKLSESFNKYNFYDTDAAYRFAYNTDVEDVKNAFYSLALGKRANYIDERLRGFHKRFETEYRKLSNEIKRLEDFISRRKKDTKKITQNSISPEIFFGEILTKLKKIKWTGNCPENKDGDMVLLENDLSHLKSKVKHIVEKTDWINSLTAKDLMQHFNYHKIIVEFADKIKRKNFDLEILEKKLLQLDEKHKIFSEVGPYFMEKEIEKLGYASEDIVKMENQKKIFSLLDEYLMDVNLDTYRNITSTVNEYGITLQSEKNGLEKVYLDNELKIENIENSISEMKTLFEGVKFSAKRMIELEPDLKNCPLCNASYEEGELLNKIEKHSLGFETSSQLEDFLLIRIETKKNLEAINGRINDYGKILKIFDLIFNEESIYQNKPVSDNILDLDDKLEALRRDIKKLEDLRSLREKFSAKGLEVDTYKTLNRKFVEYGFSISYNNKPKYVNEKEAISASLTKNQNRVQQIESEIKDLEGEMDNIWKEYPTLCNCDSYDLEQIRARKKELEEAIYLVDEIKGFVSIRDTTVLSSLLIPIDEIEVEIDNYKRSKASVEINKIYSGEIEEYEDSINILQPKCKRAKIAKDVIDELLNDYNKESALKNFLSNNTKAIIDIFSRIHTPYEGFTDISMDDDRIVLYREKEPVQINQMSTGQRAALYISVFIVLNLSLKNGPPYIIFDDPIAHIDDLNILFFLDFLRDIALCKDRQVFFSTANGKIASLFEKKFSLLGNDFVSYDLKRVLGEVKIQAINL